MRTGRKVLVGAAIVVVALLSAGSWMLSSLVKVESLDVSRATPMLDEIRARFAGLEPAFAISDGRVAMVRQPPDRAATRATSTQALPWRQSENTLSRASIPLSLLRFTTEPIPLDRLVEMLETDLEVGSLEVRIRDIQRYGPTLLLDAVTPEGDVVLIWNE